MQKNAEGEWKKKIFILTEEIKFVVCVHRKTKFACKNQVQSSYIRYGAKQGWRKLTIIALDQKQRRCDIYRERKT